MSLITRPTVKLVSFDDFCVLIKDDQKADLLDGVIHMASPENTEANDLFVWLLTLIDLFVRRRNLGKVFGSRVAFRLDRWNSPEPDIAFVARSRLKSIKWGFVQGPPNLAIEIVSPDSIRRDYEVKRLKYERQRVREYWIIDEMEQRVTLFRLGRKGKYREIRQTAGRFVSKVLPGFWIEPAWLWQSPRLLQTDVLALMND